MNREKCKKAIEYINPTVNFNERTISYLDNQHRKEKRKGRIIKFFYAGAALAACIVFTIFVLPNILGRQSTFQSSEQNVAVLRTQDPGNTPNTVSGTIPEPSPSEKNIEETVKNISLAAKARTFTSAGELFTEAEDVFTGICIWARPVFQNEMLYTLAEYKVIETFKGELKAGDVILIVEDGGITTYGNYAKNCIPEKKPGDGNWEDYYSPGDTFTLRGADGAYTSKIGDEVLLFAGDAGGFLESVKEPLYGAIGGIDGKFYKQSEGIYARALPASTDEPIFTGGKDIFGNAELVIYSSELR